MKEFSDRLNAKYRNSSAEQIIRGISEDFSGDISFSTSFGLEDQVLTDIIAKHNPTIKIFTLDTGRLFNETYKVFSATNERFNIKINVFAPEAPDIEKLMSEKGPLSFYSSVVNRKECCYLRKVKPLKRALNKSVCWITGMRAEQSPSRNDLAFFEWDEVNAIMKCNPLARWSLANIKTYINVNNVPYNNLHDKGFESIGCAPCTRSINPGEDFRAGRWWWEHETNKECGLHCKSTEDAEQ